VGDGDNFLCPQASSQFPITAISSSHLYRGLEHVFRQGTQLRNGRGRETVTAAHDIDSQSWNLVGLLPGDLFEHSDIRNWDTKMNSSYTVSKMFPGCSGLELKMWSV
jgi:hypothetical protein